ncbi:MAG: hypothetical protein COT80_04745 [Candidatus Buchananbacteria bacterium CG10_big_fil_rev_8_21_14_0_10_33_19]|uniref:Uncharacterized protein n=1 Tax=Candidatus Buchananbacteria bacterium CG10_big_fil_rev_8_21_14_0_10_33_19 TaxID=1974525 RepID=A0A2H0W417_9BACT|nr:MAG: hypothetical protein COT80_04745 [Candidatus Buchananbacteria bacterium CG10_big_fil_rev_8_21_14_0_10_33_19]
MDHFGECDCDCHNPNIIGQINHVGPCCYECPYCQMRITPGFIDFHKAECQKKIEEYLKTQDTFNPIDSNKTENKKG